MLGLYNKFNITRQDGNPQPGAFVLVPFDKDGNINDQAAYVALRAYARYCDQEGNTELAEDILEWLHNGSSPLLLLTQEQAQERAGGVLDEDNLDIDSCCGVQKNGQCQVLLEGAIRYDTGTLKSCDKEKGTCTVTVGGSDHEVPCDRMKPVPPTDEEAEAED